MGSQGTTGVAWTSCCFVFALYGVNLLYLGVNRQNGFDVLGGVTDYICCG